MLNLQVNVVILIIKNSTSYMGKKSERPIVKEQGKVVQKVPFFGLAQITVDTAVAIFTNDIIRIIESPGNKGQCPALPLMSMEISSNHRIGINYQVASHTVKSHG